MQVRTEIEIDAPVERVWEALLDFSSYPQWNPFITSVQGEPNVDGRLRVEMTTSEGSALVLHPVVVHIEPQSELRWATKLWVRRIFDGEHFFQLQRVDDGRTRLINCEEFDGLLVQYMGRRLTQMARGFVGMNQALKKRVEAASRS